MSLFKFLLLGIFSTFFVGLAYAVDLCDPDTPAWRTSAGGNYYGATKEAACAKMASGLGVPYKMGVSYGQDICTYNNQGWSFNQIMICDDGNLPNSSGKCNCNPCKSKAGMWDNGGNPQSVNLPGPLPFYSGETGGKAEMPNTVCLNGCVADTTQDRGDGMVTGSWWGYNMNPKYNGQSCTPGVQKPGTSKPKDSPEKKCVDQGMGFGYVNDKVLCVKPDNSSGTAKKNTETKNPDGTTTKVETTTNISCNAEGACSTTTTTTTTVINADGSVASTKTDTKKEDSQGNAGTGTGDGTGFCKENPTSPMCKSGSFNGSCAQAPACEGDPIQCATAKAVFETNCKTLKPGDPPTTTEPVGEKKHNLSFEVSELSGGGVCPADRFIQINGKMVHFELGVICQFAIMLRPIIIALAWLIAGYIVFGWGNKRG
ncbi:virulence factor TspB C-terminal domain-related protein [Zoogloea sp.]|uniref:virulence factor TspB C-terminal domain-related protein n=1 Tax=Zoogloea sp. TaxID=49181 RepID=UPI001415D082|nr:MAG: hypothetical protein F9K15_21930 [Zoogloea sp.]